MMKNIVFVIIAAILTLGAIHPAAAGHDVSPALITRIDDSLAKASHYLVSRQSGDGAWRSDSYPFFAQGPELTPYVLSSLFFIPQGGEDARASYTGGVDFLLSMVKEDGTIDEGPRGLTFPLHTSSMASRVVVLANRDRRHLEARKAWLDYLEARRLSPMLGWQPSDREFGGWGFFMKIPRKPADGEKPPQMCESNLSATIFGLSALRSARVPAGSPVYGEILTFVKKCQNYNDDESSADPRFDDGGFFFTPDDEVQNKAGLAGTDCHGKRRFHSYGSMTADGLRALIRCGMKKDDARVMAARKWLEWNFSATQNPGRFNAEREELRNSYYYYWLWAVAHAFQSIDVKEIITRSGRVSWAEELVTEILSRQQQDGSWVNRYTDAKEDDPLVSTPWAAATLSICRQVMTGEDHTLFPRAR